MVKSLVCRFVTIAIALLLSGAAGAANLLWNGDFGTDVSAWTIEDPDFATVAFSPIDAAGAANSGSMRIVNNHPGPGQGQGVVQCIGPVTAGATYTYSAKVLFPTGQARTGFASIGLRWRSGPGCTGTDIKQPRAKTSVPSDSWVVVNGGAEIAPAGSVSAQFVAFPSKVEAGGELIAQFDDLVFDDGLPEPPPNYQGLWWNAPAGSEPGWGINFAHQGDTIFATWFTYDDNGNPLWLAAELHLVSPGVYTGNLFTTTGPPFNAEPFDPAVVVETTVGTATLTFTDNNHATFSYTVTTGTRAKLAVAQTKNITRQLYATPIPHCVWNGSADLSLATNYQDLWWRSPAASESGWGINLTHQADTIFATWFTYDANGKPWWLAFVANKTGPGVYTGDIFTATGPPLNAVPFGGVVETVVGSAELTFADGNAASFAYTVNGISQTKPITRQVFAGNGTACR